MNDRKSGESISYLPEFFIHPFGCDINGISQVFELFKSTDMLEISQFLERQRVRCYIETPMLIRTFQRTVYI